MVSYLECRPVLARTFIIVQSAFFLLNFEPSTAFTAFKFSEHQAESGKSKRETSNAKYGDFCYENHDCNFDGGVCREDTGTCHCRHELPATNRRDKCAQGASLNEKCDFDEQCEYMVWNSMCRNNRCVCRGDGVLTRLNDGTHKCKGKQFGDPCLSDEECAFKSAVCDPSKYTCQCKPGFIATNHFDKCGEARKVNEECFFNEQCEHMLFDTVCSSGVCICRSEKTPFTNPDGSIKCVVVEQPSTEVRTDPTMIIVLSVMCLMFIIICVVLHLFSKARWRENRTIFNTPNPRLMNVSLLREKKNERRGSKEESRNAIIFRRESRGGNSNGSARSPTSRAPPSAIYGDSATPLTSEK